MPPRSRPTTPVRRVSRGSISSHHRASVSAQGQGVQGSSASLSGEKSSTPLSFLAQAMADLSYETATLQSNIEAVDEIQTALHTFDESFSMFLYGLKMNAFCVEWPEAPGEENFERAQQRNALPSHRPAAARRSSAARSDYVGELTAAPDATILGGTGADQTYMTQEDDDAEKLQRRQGGAATARSASGVMRPTQTTAPPLKSALKKSSSTVPTAIRSTSGPNSSVGPAKITAAEMKRRKAAAEQVVELLPLMYRGSDPVAKQLAVRVVLALIASGQNGVRINDIVRAPDLPFAGVHKCMLALVASKQVNKRSDNGVVYFLDAEKNPIAA